jgi:hypothetical protein
MSNEFNRNGQIIISPIKDVKNVDKRRAEINLPPLFIWAKKVGYILPSDYRY